MRVLVSLGHARVGAQGTGGKERGETAVVETVSKMAPDSVYVLTCSTASIEQKWLFDLRRVESKSLP